MVEPKQVRKHKMDRKKRVMGGGNNIKLLSWGDSHARGCASEIFLAEKKELSE